MSCSPTVVAYLGSRENASMLNISRASWARMLVEYLGKLHMNLMSLSSFSISMNPKKRGIKSIFNAHVNDCVESLHLLL